MNTETLSEEHATCGIQHHFSLSIIDPPHQFILLIQWDKCGGNSLSKDAKTFFFSFTSSSFSGGILRHSQASPDM